MRIISTFESDLLSNLQEALYLLRQIKIVFNMKYIIFSFCLLSLFIFYSCSASTDNRYSEDKDKIDVEKELKKENDSLGKNVVEDFDFTPYRTKLEIPEKEILLPTTINSSEVWYGYDESEVDTSSQLNRKVIDKVNGYRVLILTTDNLEEANNMRSEIYFNTAQKDVYVIFDPPFYKVMIGDFINYSDANDLSFKMSQLGYTECRIVNETINIFE